CASSICPLASTKIRAVIFWIFLQGVVMARHFSRTVVAMVLLTAGSAFAANHGQHGHNKGAAPGHAMAQALTAESAASMPVAQGVSASGCWIRLLPAPAPSAGYFVLKNDTDAEVAL